MKSKRSAWRKINSSNLAEAHYREKNSTMTIRFHNGDIYEYQDVPKDVFLELVDKTLESPGRFFTEKIRSNPIYKVTKVN